MTFGIGGPWDTTTPGSPSKLNKMTIVYGDGVDIAALDKTTFQFAFCVTTGSGLTVNHLYAVNAAQDSLIDISGAVDHTHIGTGTGGSLESVFRANPTFIDTGFRFMTKLDKAEWTETISGTGTTANDTTSNEESLKLLTGATSGSGATLAKTNNFLLDFAKPSHIQFMLKMSATTALALKAGVNTETVTAADENTLKYQAQLCTVTNANWNLRTATGAARSESDSGIAFTTNKVSIRLEHFPTLGTPKVDMYVDSAAAFTKTSDIPTSGSSTITSLMKFSLKNSAAADKQCFMYGTRLRYYTSSQWK